MSDIPLIERLRPHLELQGFPADRIEEFLEIANVLTRLGPALAANKVPNSKRRKHLERLKAATDAFLGELLDKDESLSEIGAPADGTAVLTHHIESADARVQDLALRNERWRKRRDACDEDQIESPTKRWNLDWEQAQHDLFEAVVEASRAAIVLRRELTDAAEAMKPKDGRHLADQHGILAEVAKAYLRIFGVTPGSSIRDPFLAIAAEITGKENPSRGVRAAIKSLP